MARHPLRTQHEDEIYFVHNMCLQEQYMLQPKPNIINDFLVALIYTLSHHDIACFGYVILLNRFYLMLSGETLKLPAFMCQFQSLVARKINKIHGRHSADSNQLVCGRYKKGDVRGILAGYERLSAMMCSMVEEGFCPSPGQWGEASSYHAIMNKGLIGPVTVDLETYEHLKERAKINANLIILPPTGGKYQVQYKLAKLPWLSHLSDVKYAKHINREVQQRASNFRRMRNHQFQNPRVYLNHPWDWKPPTPQEREIGHDAFGSRFRDPVAPSTSRGGRGRRKDQLCYALAPVRAQYWKDYRALCHEYADAMEAYVEDYDASHFPARTCRPGLMDCEKPPGWPVATPAPPPGANAASWPGPVWPQVVLRVIGRFAAGGGGGGAGGAQSPGTGGAPAQGASGSPPGRQSPGGQSPGGQSPGGQSPGGKNPLSGGTGNHPGNNGPP